jgi:hypothetical protein
VISSSILVDPLPYVIAASGVGSEHLGSILKTGEQYHEATARALDQLDAPVELRSVSKHRLAWKDIEFRHDEWSENGSGRRCCRTKRGEALSAAEEMAGAKAQKPDRDYRGKVPLQSPIGTARVVSATAGGI